MAFSRDAIARFEALDLDPAVNDRAAEFVTDRERHRNRLLRPVVPLVDMYVGAANRRPVDPDEHVVMADFRFRDVLHPDAALGFRFHQRFHQSMTPSSRPTSVNASIA